MAKKLTIEFVKMEFEKEGYVLLAKEYKNSKQKLNYVCSKGHKRKVGWNSWQQGHRCAHCNNNAKLTIEFVRTEFKKEGYRLLTEKYKNA